MRMEKRGDFLLAGPANAEGGPSLDAYLDANLGVLEVFEESALDFPMLLKLSGSFSEKKLPRDQKLELRPTESVRRICGLRLYHLEQLTRRMSRNINTPNAMPTVAHGKSGFSYVY